jgi:hypothetical protein
MPAAVRSGWLRVRIRGLRLHASALDRAVVVERAGAVGANDIEAVGTPERSAIRRDLDCSPDLIDLTKLTGAGGDDGECRLV